MKKKSSKKSKKIKKVDNQDHSDNENDHSDNNNEDDEKSSYKCPYDHLNINSIPTHNDLLDISCHDTLVQKINNSDFVFNLNVSKNVGRYAIAKQDIKNPGTLIVKEKAYAWSVRFQFLKQICTNCAVVFDLNCNPLICDLCEMAYYCSEKCKQAHFKYHEIQCTVLLSIGDICQVTKSDVDLIRTILSVISNYLLDDDSIKPASSKLFIPSKQDLLLMASHTEESGGYMCSIIRSHLRPEHASQLTTEQILFFMSIINANSHSLSRQDDPSKIFGVGLFPLSSLFNHSCYPNVQFCSENNNLIYRLMRPVKEGEELTVNYTALYQSRASRRLDLNTQKKFECHCNRCELLPLDEDQVTRFARDSFLNALTCNRPECKGYLRECFNDNNETMWICTLNSNHSATSAEAQSILDRCKASYEEAYNFYMEGMQQARTIQSASKIRSRLEESMGFYKLHLHPTHEYFFQAMLPLINCCGGEKDYRAKSDYVRQLISLAEAIHPQYFLPLCNYYEAFVQSLQQQIDYNASIGKGTPKTVLQKYKDEMITAMQHCVDIYRIACGSDHLVTKIAISKLDGIRSKRI